MQVKLIPKIEKNNEKANFNKIYKRNRHSKCIIFWYYCSPAAARVRFLFQLLQVAHPESISGVPEDQEITTSH